MPYSTDPACSLPYILIRISLPGGRYQISLQGGFETCGSHGDRPRRCRSPHIEVDSEPMIGGPASRRDFLLVDFDVIAPRRQLADIAAQRERMFEGDGGLAGAHISPGALPSSARTHAEAGRLAAAMASRALE